jgi:hypothetical protein
MDIAIIGTGNVGSALARGWAAAGHRLHLGARRPQDPDVRALVARLGAGARSVAPHEAAAAAPVVVLATPWPATREAVAGLGDLTGRVVVDCTNPLAPDLSGLALGHTTSGAEQVQSWARGAHVVKTFNQTGAENMAAARDFAVPPVQFVAGDDDKAKRTVLGLVRDLGFEAVDAGPLTSARLLEPLAMLWIACAYRFGLGRDFAFAALRREAAQEGAR